MSDPQTVTRRAVLRGSGITGTIGLAGVVSANRDSQSASATAAKKLETGAAHVDASPLPAHLDEGVYLGGYGVGPEREATGVHDGVQARALAVRTTSEAFTLVKLDLPGIGNRLIDQIRTQVAEQTSLDPQAVVVSATHAHSAPDFQGLWGGVPASYRSYLVDRAVEAAVTATSTTVPVTAAIGAIDAPGDLVFNRREWGYADTELTVVQFTRRNETVGTLINFVPHPVVISNANTLVATDYVGPLERAVEESHGGTAVFVIGANGDINPTGPGGGDASEAANNGTLTDAETYGRRVAAVVDDAIAASERTSPTLTVRSTTVRLPIDNCVFRAGFESGLMRPYYHGENLTGTIGSQGERVAGTVSERLEAKVRMANDETPNKGALAIHTPVTRISLGAQPTLEAVTIPGEALTNLGLDVRAAIGGDYQCLLGETENTLGYLVPTEEWNSGRNGSYEETVSLGYHTAPLYRDAVRRLYSHLSETSYSAGQGEWRVCPDEQVRASQQT